MRMYDCIDDKKRGKELSFEQIKYIIEGFTKGEIPDYQMAAFLMAVRFQGMSKKETYELTMLMRDSGDTLDLSKINGIKVDKHSSGGVGDKVTLVLGPIIAACGVPVAKMSGRGLGHTGGTIDKLEAIKGFNTAISEEDFIKQVNNIGLAVAGQTANLAPADKKIYALRDLTATVDQVSLIASSIMSKKLAAGSDAIVLDVKVGNGAFMKTKEDASILAKEMVDIGKNANKPTVAVLTNMDEPLGYAVGNSLEVIEAIESLKGNGPKDLMEVVFALGAQMLVLGGVCKCQNCAKEMMEEAINSGKAFNKFLEFIEAQGGDKSFALDTDKFEKAKFSKDVFLDQQGYVSKIIAEDIGIASMTLGGGREELHDEIDMSVGIVLRKKVGMQISQNEAVATVFGNDEEKIAQAVEKVRNAFSISATKPETIPMILEIIN